MFYEDILKELEDHQIQYLIVGGIAVVLHGVLRSTADLDLMVSLEPKNLKTFLTLMTEKGYKPKVPVPAMAFASAKNRRDWKKKKNMLVFSFYHPSKPGDIIDIFIDEPISFKQAFKHRARLPLGGLIVNVIGIADLIKLKKMAGRIQDIEDIYAIENKNDERVEPQKSAFSAQEKPVQYYSAKAQSQFKSMSARDRMNWLEDVNALHRQGENHRKQKGHVSNLKRK